MAKLLEHKLADILNFFRKPKTVFLKLIYLVFKIQRQRRALQLIRNKNEI